MPSIQTGNGSFYSWVCLMVSVSGAPDKVSTSRHAALGPKDSGFVSSLYKESPYAQPRTGQLLFCLLPFSLCFVFQCRVSLALVVLELALETRLALTSWRPTCLCLPSAEIKGVCY